MVVASQLHLDDEVNSCAEVLVFIFLRYIFGSILVYHDFLRRRPILVARPELLPEASRAPSIHNTLGRSKVPQDHTPGSSVNTVLKVTSQLTVSGSKFRHIRSTDGGSQTSCLGSLYYEIRVNALIGLYVRSGRGS